MLVGVSAMFSSTIIGIKLLPTTVLHHKHTGEVIISVLLLQDFIAILVMLVLQGMQLAGVELINVVLKDISLLLLALPALVAVTWVLERYCATGFVPPFRPGAGIRFSAHHRLVFGHCTVGARGRFVL